jgi:hypothetical protein
MSKRKPFNDRAGYIASLRSGYNRGWVVIYKAEEQNMSPEDGKYIVVCETHFTLVHCSSIPSARGAMKARDFCEDCTLQDQGKEPFYKPEDHA